MFAIRLSDEERIELDRAAKRADMGVTEWAREVLLNAAAARTDFLPAL